MSLRTVTVFTINAHLLQENGNTFYFPFIITAKNSSQAETLLEKYLKENKKDTGLIYKEVVGFRGEKTEQIIMDVSDNNCVTVYKEQFRDE